MTAISGRSPRLVLLLAVLGLAALAGTAAADAPAARPRAAAYTFAPYVDMTEYPAPNLVAMKHAAAIDQATLGFITAQGDSACVPTWGGYGAYPASGHRAYRVANVTAFRAAGGAAAPSFGGQAGVELASACGTEAALQGAYASVISAYRPSRIDFDIEGAALDASSATATRRSEAIAGLQRVAAAKHRKLAVSFTLPVLPSGLEPSALAVLRSAIAHGVKITFVDLMAMDYGDSAAPHPSGQMAAYAIQAAGHARRQLRRLYPHSGTGALQRLIGITPMIGINDVDSETFTLADARRLASYARSSHLGLVSMWQLERDRQCPTPNASAQVTCSSVAQRPYEFARTLRP